MRELIPIVRALWYLLAGILAAWIPLFFAIVFLPWYGKLLAVAGGLGLLAAAVIEPDREYPRLVRAIGLLLLCGLVVAGPAAFDIVLEFTDGREFSWFDGAVVGPVLCVLTYAAETLVAFMRVARPTAQ